ncbi:MAG: hypothetical protein HQ494_15650 [Rhodospirillales bacterium]|nr:hypothetical protein [Rhodospirillales bacterium]
MKLLDLSRLLSVLMIFSFVLSGCQTTSFYVSKQLARPDPGIRVLLMPIDIELSELNAGGITEPNAAWTGIAEKLVTKILNERMNELEADFTLYDVGSESSDIESDIVQLKKLHGAVGNSILLHKYLPPYELPNKNGAFNWTLGSKVRVLRKKYNADYALFVFLRDSYASDGRIAAIIIAAAFGVSMQGGIQTGFSSLVDLDSGDVVWFNQLNRGTGDLKKRKPAEETVSVLLESFPK